MAIFNSHILFLNGFLDPPKLINETLSLIINGSQVNETREIMFQSDDIHCYVYYPDFEFEAFWDKLKMIIYSLIPSIIMIVFNTLIIFKTMSLGKLLNRNDENSIMAYKKKRRLSICLILLTFLFTIMTLPNVIFYGFFYRRDPWLDKYIGGFTNNLAFFHHACLFLSLFFTNTYFRSAVYSVFPKKKDENNTSVTKSS